MSAGRLQGPERCRGSAGSLFAVVVLFLIASSGIAWVSMGLYASDRWPIRWLEINGGFQRVSAEQLRASLTPLIDRSFFALDLEELRAAAGRISWVSSVQVRKVWPDTVAVAITEYRPVAHWNRGELISDRGQAFSVPEADELQGLPWLSGPPDRLGEVLRHWSDFSEMLVPFGLEIRRLKLDPRGSWAMVLSNDTRVQLGRDAATERLSRLLGSWNELMRDRALPPSDVDLRYTNGFAVAWSREGEAQTGKDS